MPLTDIDGQRLGDSVADKLGNRNLIINGAMQVAQRGTSFTSQTSGAYYLDRFQAHTFNLGSGVYRVDQSTDAPDGFEKSFKLSCTTAEGSTNANAQMSVYQALEGYDTSFLKYFQANPDTVTISFYVKSNRTGTFSAALKLSDNGSYWGDGSTRIYNFTYSISTADTWERKTASITLDSATTETKVINENFAVAIQWWQLAGTSRDGATANSWVNNTNVATDSDNLRLLESTNNNWFITGVQLEVGNTATPFEHRSYGDELSRCHRYYWQQDASSNYARYGIVSVESATAAETVIHLPTTMRIPPALLHGTVGNSVVYSALGLYAATALAMDNTTVNAVCVAITSSGMTGGRAGTFLSNNTTDFYLAFNAEL
ncbi:MAG: hypothetical protein VW270_15580 [Candidatus Poseidoniales archaeon]